MKMYLLKCPNCDATLEVEPDRKMLFCSYCGSKIIVDDEVKRVEITKNINYHETYTDEAKIKETISREKIRLQEMEYADKEKKRNDKVIFISIGLLFLIMLLAFGMSHYYSEKSKPNENEVKISVNANDYKGELFGQVNVKDSSAAVTLNNLNAEIYWTINGCNIRATASGVHAVNKSDKY